MSGKKKAAFAVPKLGAGARAGDGEDEMDDAEGSRHIRWDEDTIAEHDKLRGTRQKIDEPDTPFHRDSFDSEADEDFDEDGGDVKVVFSDGVKPGGAVAPTTSASTDKLDMNALQSQLDKAADSEDTRPAAAQKSAHDDFVSKRKQHYNEIEALRRWREQHPEGDEDENDDDDDDDL